jgi:hypothetical protein
MRYFSNTDEPTDDTFVMTTAARAHLCRGKRMNPNSDEYGLLLHRTPYLVKRGN